MAGFALRKNMAFDWLSIHYRIDRIQPNDDVLLERISDGHLSLVNSEHLLAEYREGKVSARTAEAPPNKTSVPTFSRPLEELADHVKQKVVRRKHYLEKILAYGVPVFTADYLKPLIKLAAAEIADENPPGITSFYRWHKRFTEHSDARAIIPRTDRCGPRTLLQSDRILQLAEEAMAEVFNRSPQASGYTLYERLCDKIELENQRQLGAKPLKAPSRRTVYRMLKRTDAYDLTVLKEGKSVADRRFRISKAGVKTSRIMERVEIDHTPLDLFLIDERTWLPLGRPTLTVVIDHYSRMLLGYYLSFEGPSTAAVMGALRHAILPKKLAEPVIANLKIVNSWPCYGIPEKMVLDNGFEFHSDDLDSVGFDLGSHIQFCPKHSPWYKGVVERYLGTINCSFVHQLPGTSFSRFYQRGDYDPQKAALLTFAEFKQVFEKWVVDIYAQDLHGGIGTTPMARWQESMTHHQPILPNDLQTFQRHIGKVYSRSLRHDGILLNWLYYRSDELAPIMRSYGEGVKVRIVSDPEDLGEIYVWGPDDAEPIIVKAVEYDYAKGLTAKQNKFIRLRLIEQGEAAVDKAVLRKAKQDLAQAVEDLMTSRKLKDRRRSGALRGISSSKPNGSDLNTDTKPDVKKVSKPQKNKASEVVEQSQEQSAMEIIGSFQMKRWQGGRV
ncbi:Mu transposase C-terminal domain-containing protein [Candidatus Methylobacter oryzae]|uniref:DDE-type integrase/transposase/recombinase n=1 Tax=Candidatus Methylobacter oryzae TaxID=2497749 RepID=A0ABY3CDS2_9GAMM|nr:Mu transposase C-terminal domain-containing protein [Candidatus Methylobacter oryzae]TRW98581.1 DDE-type integrase/transposase/recombinase [Candidatus Methylobacter oryzae]